MPHPAPEKVEIPRTCITNPANANEGIETLAHNPLMCSLGDLLFPHFQPPHRPYFPTAVVGVVGSTSQRLLLYFLGPDGERPDRSFGRLSTHRREICRIFLKVSNPPHLIRSTTALT